MFHKDILTEVYGWGCSAVLWLNELDYANSLELDDNIRKIYKIFNNVGLIPVTLEQTRAILDILQKRTDE